MDSKQFSKKYWQDFCSGDLAVSCITYLDEEIITSVKGQPCSGNDLYLNLTIL